MDPYHVLIIGLAVFGIAAILLHIKYYQELYTTLRSRGVVGEDYAPDWISKFGSFGCMGFIVRIKREVGVATLKDNESSLLHRVVIAYSVGTLATFVAVGLFFWGLYGPFH